MLKQYDYLIIGAGPAGLQLSYFLEKGGRDYLVLEASDTPGNSFKHFPRHRTLISINKVYTGYEDQEINMRWDWNALLSDNKDLVFKNYSKKYFPDAEDYVRYLGDFASHFNLKIKYGVKVVYVATSVNYNKMLTEIGSIVQRLKCLLYKVSRLKLVAV